MKNKSSLLMQEEQIVLSYELLQLMEWLLKYDLEGLKKLIAKNLKRGLAKNIALTRTVDSVDLPEADSAVVANFISLLEILLVETHAEMEQQQLFDHDLPELAQVDLSNCSLAVLQDSAESALSRKEQNPQANTRELLYKELLRRWKPSKQLHEN
ncbi:MAG TPA: hypothetical protein VJJ83_03810 [Candidatus Babeliales bacterium]|nr:hypothetical protein [Candidatus Babeliales bacterium]